MAKARAKRNVMEGVAHIQATFNNTIISISHPSGDVLCHCSTGRVGFKNSRKSTPYAAQLAAEEVGKKAVEVFGMRRVAVRVSGPGAGRDSAIRSLRGAGLEITSLTDTTKLPHNGCRPRKKRRV